MAHDPHGTTCTQLCFSLCGCLVRVQCEDALAGALLAANYELRSDCPARGDLEYVVRRPSKGMALCLQRRGHPALRAVEESEFLFRFEEALLLDLQRVRQDLYFLHAAVLEYSGSACVLVAPSGGGKSTTTWALLHHGFGYGSDEVGAVDLRRMRVHTYPHALCLKQPPPAAYPLPRGVLRTAHRLYVPLGLLPARVHHTPLPLTTICFLQYDAQAMAPVLEPVSKAEAGTRLFANALNALAHAGEGLDGAIEIASTTSCWSLISTDLRETCRLLHATLLRVESRARGGTQQQERRKGTRSLGIARH